MSDVLVERARIEQMLHMVSGRCCYCGCAGGSCSTDEPGEKCVLIGALQSRCNGFTCNREYWAGKKAVRRRWKRGRGA